VDFAFKKTLLFHLMLVLAFALQHSVAKYRQWLSRCHIGCKVIPGT